MNNYDERVEAYVRRLEQLPPEKQVPHYALVLKEIIAALLAAAVSKSSIVSCSQEHL